MTPAANAPCRVASFQPEPDPQPHSVCGRAAGLYSQRNGDQPPTGKFQFTSGSCRRESWLPGHVAGPKSLTGPRSGPTAELRGRRNRCAGGLGGKASGLSSTPTPCSSTARRDFRNNGWHSLGRRLGAGSITLLLYDDPRRWDDHFPGLRTTLRCPGVNITRDRASQLLRFPSQGPAYMRIIGSVRVWQASLAAIGFRDPARRGPRGSVKKPKTPTAAA